MLQKNTFPLNHFNPKKPVLISYSCGPDSRYLLDTIQATYPSTPIHLIYFNHGLRAKSEIDNDIRHINALHQQKKISITIRRIPVTSYSKRYKCSIETAGHLLRKQLLIHHAKLKGITQAMTAHHQDDDIETFLLKKERQVENRYLGIYALQTIDALSIFRPLLHISKKEILAYLKQNNLDYTIDSSNTDLSFSRNKIRHNTIKKLSNHDREIISNRLRNEKSSQYNAYCAINRMLKTSYLFGQEFHIPLSTINSSENLTQCLLSVIHDAINKLNTKHLNPHIVISKAQINDLKKSFKKKSGKSNLSNDHIAEVNHEEIIIYPKQRTPFSRQYEYHVQTFPNRIRIPEDKTVFHIDIIPNQLALPSINGAYIQIQNESDCQIVIRNRRAGDYFHPKGMPKKVKLKHYFINQKIPKSKRDNLPLFFIKNNLVWIKGHHINHNFQVNAEARHVLKIEVMNDE